MQAFGRDTLSKPHNVSKIKDLVDLLDILCTHNPLMHVHACTLHLHPIPMHVPPIHACTYQCVRTQTFHIEGWQGSTPTTGAALTGGSHPHTCILATSLCHLCQSPHPSLHLSHAPAFAPHAPLVHVATPHTHTPCTVHVHTHTIHTIPMCTIHMSMPHHQPGLCVTDNSGTWLSLSIVG